MRKTSMPVLFVGHGSPMNALERNDFTRRLGALGAELPRPKAVVCISAHWETPGTQVLVNDLPETIHDFYGFPEQLNKYRYPASGAATLARRTVDLLSSIRARETSAWGLDHGTWTVLTHLYPKADVPVFQLSLDQGLAMQGHYALGKLIAPLRAEGVLILGSGNIVHNLGRYDPASQAKPYAWAVEFDDAVKAALLTRDIEVLTDPARISPVLAKLAMPTIEHYLPLLYVFGAARPEDRIVFPYEGIQNASMSMRMVMLGK